MHASPRPLSCGGADAPEPQPDPVHQRALDDERRATPTASSASATLRSRKSTWCASNGLRNGRAFAWDEETGDEKPVASTMPPLEPWAPPSCSSDIVGAFASSSEYVAATLSGGPIVWIAPRPAYTGPRRALPAPLFSEETKKRARELRAALALPPPPGWWKTGTDDYAGYSHRRTKRVKVPLRVPLRAPKVPKLRRQKSASSGERLKPDVAPSAEDEPH